MEKSTALKARKRTKAKKPHFGRQEKRSNLTDTWRKPKGRQSKLRMKEKARGKLPTPGYGSPKLVRGLNRQGLSEIIVRNTSDLSGIRKKEDVVVISRTVGKKKKIEIIKKAEEMGLKVHNPLV